MPTPKKKGESVTKTLISLIQSDPANRSCADCQSSLVDPSYVYASLCPSLKERKRGDKTSQVAVAFHDFQLTHRAFAPPDVKKRANFGEDPAHTINQRIGGHGLFICNKCAEAHKTLGDTITKIIAVHDASAWTKAEAQLMKNAGGNTRSRVLYEAFIPETWKGRRPTPSSALDDRVVFCKAKYEALAFVMPPPGPLSKVAWLSILERNETGKRFGSSGLRNIHHLVPTFPSTPSQVDGTRTSGGALPERLIDFFCVVSYSMQLHPGEFARDLSNCESPEELNLWPQVLDCYPSQDAYSDMVFPLHLPNFVLPKGCCPSKTQQAPTFYTFVLTLGDGDRLYGGALQIYDEHIEMEELKDLVVSSGYEGSLPRFLEHDSDIVFLPKCLVLLSHYPFFDMFRESLLQLYRITLVEAPLPIERYIANLVSEVPLPPKGKIRVEFGFTMQNVICIERPPANKLPLANFSYRPLFASLSVGNIMVVLGCLMEECKVALLSKNFSILTPVAEALLSALFPFEWQGLYIPVMPYAMLDILDAPVPFVVGLDSRYLHEISPARRPMHVVFVDLDRDVIHLGIDDLTDENRKVPCLPPRDAMKLKARLDESGGSMYLLPNSGIKGCIMEGHEELLLLPNESRPKYAQMQSVTLDSDFLRRSVVLERTKKAYDENELLEGVTDFRTVHGQMKEQDGHESDSSCEFNGKRIRRLRKPKFMRNKRAEMLESSMVAGGQAHLLDMVDPEGFSPTGIRNAFLRFMVATFENYSKFIMEDKDSKELFDEYRFLRDLGEEKEPTAFMARVLKTQMFQRFLEERMEDPDHPEIRFFDESILAKMNRSKVQKMAKGGTLPTPFLDDESGKITKTYTPPPPSNLGLPESAEAYHYNKFPPLEQSLYGRVRHPMMWHDRRSISKRMRSIRNITIRKTQQDILRRAMNPLIAPAAIAAMAKRSAKDLETALTALKGLQWGDMQFRTLRPKRDRDSKEKGKSRLANHKLRKSTSVESVESTESERTVTTISKADTIMMNARRKQSILLDIVIMLQASFRMFFARSRYVRLRRAVFHLQRRFRRNFHPTPSEGNTKYGSEIDLAHVLKIQRDVRRFLARKVLKKSKMAVSTLQRNVRGIIARRRFVRQRASAVTIQRHMKGRRVRYSYRLLRVLVCRLQARFRGVLVRKTTQEILEGSMALYRTEVVSLWQSGHAALSLRTKMWPTFSSTPSFAKLRVAKSELRRMWDNLGIDIGTRGKTVSDRTTKLATSLGIDMTTYCICQELSLFSNYGTPFQSLRDALRQAYEYEEAERLQIHDRLDTKAFEHRAAELYSVFGIPAGEKMKKVALARAMWSNHSLAEKSKAAMMELFPELEGSLNVVFQQASGKSKRRFPDAPKSPLTFVTKDFWETISLEGLIKRHTLEVTNLYINKVPSIMARLDAMDKAKLNSSNSMWTMPVVTEGSRNLIQSLLYQPSPEAPKDFVSKGNLYPKPAPQGEATLLVQAINSAPFPDIDLTPNREDDPVTIAQFPNIGLDESNEKENGLGKVEFPLIDSVAVDPLAKAINSAPFPDIDLTPNHDEDPVKIAQFPDIGLDDSNEKENGLPEVQFPLVESVSAPPS